MNPNRQIDSVQYGDNTSVSYPFKDNFSLYLVKKVEKVVLATYLITEHLSSREPIKQSIRNSSTQLIKDIIKSIEDRDDNSSRNIQSSLLHLESLLNLGAKTCLLTQANVSIVKDEVSRISKEVNSHNDAVDGNALIKKSFFVVDVPKDSSIKDIKDTDTVKRTSFKDMSDRNTLKATTRLAEADSKLKAAYNKKGESNTNKGTVNSRTSSKSGRSDEIVEIVKKKGKVTIKDVSAEITDCSEKTIQRELQKLVSSGVLNKEGERRWSTYSLI